MIHGTATENRLTLDGKVYCANCGAEMRNTGSRYYCPNTTVESGANCPTKPLDTKHLLRTVVDRMVSRLATEETVESVIQDIMDSTRENARIQRRRMEETEDAIVEATARRSAVPQADERGGDAHESSSDEITGVDTVTAGLAFEAMVARNELDKIEFISDEVGLRESAKDPETYMGGNNDQDAQELLNLLIRKVIVDNGQATIVYEEPMPADGDSKGIIEDPVPLKQGSLH